MKKLKLLFLIILLSAGLNMQAQNFTIQAFVFEECLPNSVNIMVSNAPPGATNFVWFTGTPHCGSAFSETIYDASGNFEIWTTTSGIYYCRAEVTGTGYIYSNMVAARLYPPSGSPVLLVPPFANIVTSCSTELCIPLPNWNLTLNPILKWYKNNVEIAGATDYSYTASTAGYYKYAAESACGWKYSDSILVSVSLPQSQITAGGATTFCSGGSVVLNANTGTGLTYQWKLNTAAISGATNSTYNATAAGSYTVVVTNSCSSATSSAITVTVKSLPSASITPAGPTTFCSGGNVVLNTLVATNRSYQWKKGANLIPCATLASYSTTTGGNYKVIVTNTITGCSKTTGSATAVTVNALSAATITPQGPTTFCAGGSVVLSANTGAELTYKWKKGSNFISGATLSNYTATTGGNYKVQVTNSNGCSKTSGNVTVSVPCKEGENISLVNNFDVKVFPNPSSEDFLFEIQNAKAEIIYIIIYDIIGKIVLSENTFNSEFTISNSKLCPGIYSAVITNGENKQILMLIKK